MADQFTQTCFQIEAKDNVCTALTDLVPGAIKVNGNTTVKEIAIHQAIQNGHKVANQEIREDEPIIKYGVIIGKATCLIHSGEWVHLHNCRSLYDERSGTLDVKTGAPTDTKYE
jgi:altronate dehydratase small subunit